MFTLRRDTSGPDPQCNFKKFRRAEKAAWRCLKRAWPWIWSGSAKCRLWDGVERSSQAPSHAGRCSRHEFVSTPEPPNALCSCKPPRTDRGHPRRGDLAPGTLEPSVPRIRGLELEDFAFNFTVELGVIKNGLLGREALE